MNNLSGQVAESAAITFQQPENRAPTSTTVPARPVRISKPAQATSTTAASISGRPLVAVIYKGGATCSGCPEAAARALVKDALHRWTIRYVGEGQPLKVNSENLKDADLYVQPAGDTIESDWPKLTRTGQRAIKEYTEGGGRYLGLCLGGFLTGRFGGMGFGWIGGVDTYQGPKYADGEIVKTTWGGQSRFMWWEGGAHFGRSKPGTRVLGVYENGKPAAVVVPAGRGKVAAIGPHAEADPSWYSSVARSSDDDGPDADLLLRLVHALMV